MEPLIIFEDRTGEVQRKSLQAGFLIRGRRQERDGEQDMTPILCKFIFLVRFCSTFRDHSSGITVRCPVECPSVSVTGRNCIAAATF